jgi:hypothetical protein
MIYNSAVAKTNEIRHKFKTKIDASAPLASPKAVLQST